MKKMKKFLMLIPLFVILIITSGCGANDTSQIDQTGKILYDLKRLYVIYTDSELSSTEFLGGDIDNLFVLAERDIQYHFSFPDDYPLLTSYSATANIGYNLAYMINTPAKLIQNIRYDYKFVDETWDFDEEVANEVVDEADMEMFFTDAVSKINLWSFIIMDALNAIIGCFFAYVMLHIGTLFGFLCHPIDTFINIPHVLWSLFESIYYAVIYIFKLWN